MPTKNGYFVFDADNHLYEPIDAFTRHMPAEYGDFLRYVQVEGRTKLVVNGMLSDYIPNPTFEVVAAPGCQEDYFRNGNPEGKSRREIMGKAIRSPGAFFNAEDRIKLMDEQGIDRTLMWPTLASVLEARVMDAPREVAAAFHSLNQFIMDEWTFNYQDRIFATPVVNMGELDLALKELDYIIENNAKILLVRPAPHFGFEGPHSPFLPKFDPFWKRVEEAGIVVGLHASDSGYQRYINEWEGIRGEMTPFKAQGAQGFNALVGHSYRAVFDTVASAIGHGACSRFPKLRLLPVENGSGWVLPFLEEAEHAYRMNPRTFEEDPVEVFHRNIWVHPFHEDNPRRLVDAVGSDRVVFGSDYPHAEGLKDPVGFVTELEEAGLNENETRDVMGNTLNQLMGFPAVA